MFLEWNRRGRYWGIIWIILGTSLFGLAPSSELEEAMEVSEGQTARPRKRARVEEGGQEAKRIKLESSEEELEERRNPVEIFEEAWSKSELRKLVIQNSTHQGNPSESLLSYLRLQKYLKEMNERIEIAGGVCRFIKSGQGRNCTAIICIYEGDEGSKTTLGIVLKFINPPMKLDKELNNIGEKLLQQKSIGCLGVIRRSLLEEFQSRKEDLLERIKGSLESQGWYLGEFKKKFGRLIVDIHGWEGEVGELIGVYSSHVMVGIGQVIKGINSKVDRVRKALGIVGEIEEFIRRVHWDYNLIVYDLVNLNYGVVIENGVFKPVLFDIEIVRDDEVAPEDYLLPPAVVILIMYLQDCGIFPRNLYREVRKIGDVSSPNNISLRDLSDVKEIYHRLVEAARKTLSSEKDWYQQQKVEIVKRMLDKVEQIFMIYIQEIGNIKNRKMRIYRCNTRIVQVIADAEIEFQELERLQSFYEQKEEEERNVLEEYNVFHWVWSLSGLKRALERYYNPKEGGKEFLEAGSEVKSYLGGERINLLGGEGYRLGVVRNQDGSMDIRCYKKGLEGECLGIALRCMDPMVALSREYYGERLAGFDSQERWMKKVLQTTWEQCPQARIKRLEVSGEQWSLIRRIRKKEYLRLGNFLKEEQRKVGLINQLKRGEGEFFPMYYGYDSACGMSSGRVKFGFYRELRGKSLKQWLEEGTVTQKDVLWFLRDLVFLVKRIRDETGQIIYGIKEEDMKVDLASGSLRLIISDFKVYREKEHKGEQLFPSTLAILLNGLHGFGLIGPPRAYGVVEGCFKNKEELKGVIKKVEQEFRGVLQRIESIDWAGNRLCRIRRLLLELPHSLAYYRQMLSASIGDEDIFGLYSRSLMELCNIEGEEGGERYLLIGSGCRARSLGVLERQQSISA